MLQLLLLVAIGGVFGVTIDLAKYQKDGYFGKQSLKAGQSIPADNTAIRPFNISIPHSDLDDLQARLVNARFIEHLPGTAFHYGFSSHELSKIVQYWNKTFDWRTQEAKLNAYPQFLTQIEGIDIHYVHVKASPKAKNVIPLLSVHGWPSSFMEIYKSLPMLTEPDVDGLAFEVIAPSIPGFGYGEAAHQSGLENTAVARIFAKLLSRLGHEKYLLQGGDWGSAITRAMAILYPEHAIGIHIVGLIDALEKALGPQLPAPPSSQTNQSQPSIQELLQAFEETGVLHLMATKPDTLASALADSPVALAAHILEKFSSFTNIANQGLEDGGLTKTFTLDELLTNVMIYWTSGNVAATCRIYKELVRAHTGITSQQITIPTGIVDAPNEVLHLPRPLIDAKFPHLLQFTMLPRGGHFTIWEEPALVADDLRVLTKKILKKTTKF